MIQGGDPTGTGAGGPGYRFADELPKALDYTKGTIAMANAGLTQRQSIFYHARRLQPPVTQELFIFGKVTAGQDVVDKIGNIPTKCLRRENSAPLPMSILTPSLLPNNSHCRRAPY